MRWASEHVAVFAGVLSGACTIASGTRAEGVVDPSYGRVEGDLALVVGVGGTVSSGGVRPEAELRARYLETAGVYGTYEDGPVVGLSRDPVRIVMAGFELRPLFLYRWLRGYETHGERLDLIVDSAGLELGLAWAQPDGGSFPSRPGFDAGFGVEFPLTVEPSGLWVALHGGVRWSDFSLATGAVEVNDEREVYLSITLAWHQRVVTHLVDVGDRAPR
jgi:hypothetical protein